MDKTLATKVIDTARFYMSGDNCQPFRYRFNLAEQCFYLDYIAEEAKHTFVYDDYTILLTLGSALSYLDITLQHYNYSHEINFDFSAFSPYQDSIGISSITVKPLQSQNNASLFCELTKRVTDRRPYLGADTINISIPNLNAQLNHSECKLYIDTGKALLDFFASCDSAIWYSKALGIDIMNAVAFDADSTKGLPWRNLGVKKSDAWLIRAIQRYHWLFDVLKHCGARLMMKQTQKRLWMSSKSVLVFAYKGQLTRENKTLASKEMMQVLLELSKQGYVFQPSTMSAEILNLPLKSNNIVSASHMQPSPLTQQVSQQRKLLRLEDEEIQWVLRIGKVAKSIAQEALTKRHNTEDLLSFE